MYIFQHLVLDTCTLHTSLLSDASARWEEMNGDIVKLVTGTDQHGMKYSTPLPKKIYQVQQYCDSVASKYNVGNLF